MTEKYSYAAVEEEKCGILTVTSAFSLCPLYEIYFVAFVKFGPRYQLNLSKNGFEIRDSLSFNLPSTVFNVF